MYVDICVSSDSEFWADEAAWQAKIVADKFDVTVPEHKQVSGGFFAKSYTTYQVISPLCVEGVWRRYSDFEFIRDMLVSRFHGLIVPLLPDKRVVGNMEDTFIESRRVALNEWVRKVRAPMSEQQHDHRSSSSVVGNAGGCKPVLASRRDAQAVLHRGW